MAGGMNKVFLMGNLTRDIELRRLPSNQAVAAFGVAVNRKFKTAAGEVKEEVTFVDCDAWGKTAEIMAQYLSKGKRVLIEGRLRLDTWQDKESGANRSKLKVVVESFHFVDSRGENAGGADGAPGVQVRQSRPGAPAAAGGAPAESGAGYEPIQEDDIPF